MSMSENNTLTRVRYAVESAGRIFDTECQYDTEDSVKTAFSGRKALFLATKADVHHLSSSGHWYCTCVCVPSSLNLLTSQDNELQYQGSVQTRSLRIPSTGKQYFKLLV